ncbi:MAG: septum formation inhibitor Maf [Oscillatoriales cyanobacterium C42_A2020_001]|nr:septum formation inhibitor Maf [Leptolyngbyaceae cyanobacterium C42_A2020_001]
MGTPRFVLASASPARKRLLQTAGIDPIVQPSYFDEDQIQSSDPALLVKTLAIRKADAVAAQLAAKVTVPTLVMGCDSVLAINGEIHGKPASPKDAIARWQTMRGQIGSLYTGHALIELLPISRSEHSSTPSPQASLTHPPTHSPTPRSLLRCQITQVYFTNASDRQIAAYVATGEPLNCAGCFALEGKGGLFVERLEGCHTNVIGLSLPLLRQMLTDLGYEITDFWER